MRQHDGLTILGTEHLGVDADAVLGTHRYDSTAAQ
jgi:hypothetical protein